MNASHRARGVPPKVTGLLVLSVVGALTASCTASSVSSPSASPSPPFSPHAEPNPSPEFSPVVEPSPSPPPSPYVDPNWTWEPAGEMVGVPDGVIAAVVGGGRVMVMAQEWTPDDTQSPAVQIWDPATNTWTVAADLGKVRSDFALVALADGRALVAGGLNEGGRFEGQSYSSAYVVNPIIGPRPGLEEWTKVGLMTTARTAPSASLLPDGRVLVAGGYFNTGSSEAAVPTPDTEPAIALAAYQPAPVGDPRPTRPPLDDMDTPLHGYALATAEVFDPATSSWSRTGSMRYARAGAAAVTLADGRILVVGSSDASVTGLHPDAYNTAEIYDPATGRFSLAGWIPDIDAAAIKKLGVVLPADGEAPGAVGSLVALSDGGALLVGSTRWWKHTADVTRTIRFDVRSGSWSEVGQPCASAWDDSHQDLAVTPGVCRLDAMVAGLPDGRVLVAGGTSRYMYVSPVTTSAELYDPTTDTWIPITSMPEGRADGSTVVLNDGSVLIVGGRDSEYVQLRSAVRFSPRS